jgi:hypothetical protein
MTALAFLMIPVLLIPLVRPVHGALAVSFDAADYVIWPEAHAKGSTIHSYGGALWWAVVTVTSVGYADQYSVTVAGRAVAGRHHARRLARSPGRLRGRLPGRLRGRLPGRLRGRLPGSDGIT